MSAYPLLVLPKGVAWGYKKSPKFTTTLQTPQSGRGQASATLAQSVIYDIELNWNYLKVDGVTTDNDFAYLLGFYEAMRGSYGRFLFDPSQSDFETLSLDSNLASLANGFSAIAPGMNYLLWSSDVSNSTAWTFAGSGAAAPTFTEYEPAPPGDPGNAQEFSFPAVPEGTNYSRITQTASGLAVSGNTYTFSVWMYAAVADTITLTLGTADGLQSSTETPTLAVGWSHISITATFSTTASTSLVVSIERSGASAAQPSTEFAIYCPMLEWASAAGTIPTLTTTAALTGQTTFPLYRSSGVLGGGTVTTLEQIQNVTVLGGMYLNGTVVPANQYTTSNFPAQVTFDQPPATGSIVTWAGNYSYLCHFADDTADFEEFMYQLWEMNSLKLETVLL